MIKQPPHNLVFFLADPDSAANKHIARYMGVGPTPAIRVTADPEFLHYDSPLPSKDPEYLVRLLLTSAQEIRKRTPKKRVELAEEYDGPFMNVRELSPNPQ